MELNVFPNPADNIVTLVGEHINASHVVVINAEGKNIRNVLQFNWEIMKLKLKLAHYPKGYILYNT